MGRKRKNRGHGAIWQADAGLFDEAEKNIPRDKDSFYSSEKGVVSVGFVALKIALAGDRARADRLFAQAEAYDQSMFSKHTVYLELAALEFEAGFIPRAIETLSKGVERAEAWHFYHFSKMAEPLLRGDGSRLFST